MPKVLDTGRFQVWIYHPPREHGSPHVHIFVGGAEVEIYIGDKSTDPSLKRVTPHTRRVDARAALLLVREHQQMLLETWYTFHPRTSYS